jgi:predicted dehydrogenase
MKKYRTGIVGYGFMGRCHGDMLATLDEMEFVAAADTNLEQLKDVPKEVRTYESIDAMLEQEILDVIIISTPNPSHLEMVEKIAKAGIHVICEKPAAMSVEQFDRMVEVTKEHNVLFTVHQQRRWDKDYRIMKEVYRNRLVGDMYVIKSQLYGVNGNMHDWHIYPEMGGGMLYDWGVHLIDQILDMVDSDLDSLYADVRNIINKEVDDYFNIILKFKNQVTAEIELGTYYLTPKRAWFIGGTTGSAIIDGFAGEGCLVRTQHLLENVPGKITMTAAGPTRSFGPPPAGLLIEEPLPEVNVNHRDFFLHFIKTMRGEEEIRIKADEVRKVLCVMDAVRESAKTGNAIRF